MAVHTEGVSDALLAHLRSAEDHARAAGNVSELNAARSEAFLTLLLNLLSKFGDSWAGVANIERTYPDFVETDDEGNGFVQCHVVTPEGREFRIEVEYVGERVNA